MHRRTFLALGSASTASLLGAGPLLARGRDRPTPDQLVGTWEGQVLFVNGWRATARVTLAPTAGGGVEGTYALTLQDEDGPDEVRQGQVALPSGVDATLLLVTQNGAMRWNGAVGPAGTHALAAFHGTFDGGGQDRGVFMLFRYRG